MTKDIEKILHACFHPKESGLTKERLEYYTNAYEASGESGLRALSYRKRMPEDIREGPHFSLEKKEGVR